VTHSAIASCATFLFLPHVDVICDLLLNRRSATWNLFVNYAMLCLEFNKLDEYSASVRKSLQGLDNFSAQVTAFDDWRLVDCD